MEESPKLTAISTNFKKQVDWILGAYSDAGISFSNGFQKDAIQNAVGARKTNKWKNWHCDIRYISNNKGSFVVVEDSGTVGLTGHNISQSEIRSMVDKGVELPSEERLARFSSMFNSGDNRTGGGLFGAGKSVYSVASIDYTYYFDSLREDGLYVANENRVGQIYEKAREGKDGEIFIYDNTGLERKETVGTRIIIKNPKPELVESILARTIIDDIQESWWIIMERFGNDSAITVNGEKVTVPKDIKKTKYNYEVNTESADPTGEYKTKHFGFYVFKDGGNKWSGISYYRKGMKIGEVTIKDIPKSVENKYWGYIEVDENWEEELAGIENNIHFGVSKHKSGTTCFVKLKNYCYEKINKCLVGWGFKKDNENLDKKLNEQLRQIAGEVQDLFDKLGFEDLGKGPQKPDFDVRWQDIQYPNLGSEKVSTGDVLSFAMRIKSDYITEKKFEYRISVINPKTKKTIWVLDDGKVTIQPGKVEKKPFSIIINRDVAEQYEENRVVLTVKVVNSNKSKTKELPFFYDIDKPDNKKDTVTLTLHECTFPREGSRRVNFGEQLTNVCYRIENKRNHSLSYRLNVSVHNASDSSNPQIISVISFTGMLAPFEEIITPYIKSIVFDQKVYEKYLTEGTLELRARLAANEDDAVFDEDNPVYEKGDKITNYYYKLFLNMDEKHGKNDSFKTQSVNAPDDYKRSWCETGTDRTIYLNVGHVAYLNIKDQPDIQYEYIREQMLKQYVLLYLKDGKTEMFRMNNKDFSDLDPYDAADQVLARIEQVYYQSLK